MELNTERKGAMANGIFWNRKETQGLRIVPLELNHVTEGTANLEVLLGNLLEDSSCSQLLSLPAGHNSLAELR